MVLDLDPEMAVRLLIADLDQDRQLVTDEQISQYLALNAGSVRRAAADILDAVAVSEALVSKVIRTQDLQTDGAKLAAELRARANQLRQQADNEDSDEWGGFDIIDTPTSTRRPEYTNPQVWGL